MAETKMQLADWLDDLCVRFIINLPQEELESVERICFQVEEAQWFYEDFIRPLDSSLPSMNLRQFCLLIFQYCPFLADFSESQHVAAYSQFLAYKTRVPVRGAIMLNQDMDQVLLVKGWKKGANWSFPRGKINKDERDLDCAVREVYEETGFDIAATGLAREESDMKYIEVTMREQHMKLYVFRGVPTDTLFQPRTRKEISKIQWYKLASLPGYTKKKDQRPNHGEESLNANKLYMVAPFLMPLKKWIAQQRKQDKVSHTHYESYISDFQENTTDADNVLMEEVLTGPENHRMASEANVLPPRGLSNLNAMRQQSDIPRSVADPAAELKRMLSVGESEQQMPPKQPSDIRQSNPDALLAILKGSRNNAETQIQEPHGPQTPREQISHLPQEPSSPHYHHARPPNVSQTVPPPGFPLISSNLGSHPPGPDLSGPGPPAPPQGLPPHMQGDSISVPLRSTQRTAGALDFQSPTDLGQNIRAPYQRTGDPRFAPASNMPSSSHPANVVPSASQLPPPKLNSHTMNLLNAFKSSNPAPKAPPNLSGGPLARLDTTNATGRPRNTDRRPSTPSEQEGPRSSSQPSFSGLIPSILSPVSARTPKPPAQTPKELSAKTPQPKPNAQQESLLKLFKSPAKPNTPPFTHQEAGSKLTPAPAELSAAPSPGLTSRSRQLDRPIDSPVQDVSSRSMTDALQRTAAPASGLADTLAITSATLKGPNMIPDFDKARDSARASKEVSPVKERQAPEAVEAPMVQILRRRPEETKPNQTSEPKQSKPNTNKMLPAGKESAELLVHGFRTAGGEPNAVELLRGYGKVQSFTISNRLSRKNDPVLSVIMADAAQADAAQRALDCKVYDGRMLTVEKSRKQGIPAKEATGRDAQKSPRTPAKKSEAVINSPKPFQPQILRRPQYSANASGDAGTKTGQDQQSVSSEYQKNTLLSLFSPPKESRPARSEGVSPATPTNAAALNPTSLLETLRSSPGEMPPQSNVNANAVYANNDLPRSRMTSASSAVRDGSQKSGAGSGPQTPISPGDRGFLLNYLEGAAKKTSRA